jgi:hypothetical protein
MMNFLRKLIHGFEIIKTFRNWPTNLLDRYGLCQGEVIYALYYKDIRIKARAGTDNRFILEEVYARRIYTSYGLI